MTYYGVIIFLAVVTITATNIVMMPTALFTTPAALLPSMKVIIITWGFHVFLVQQQIVQQKGIPWNKSIFLVFAFGALVILEPSGLALLCR
jgi:hypothetical protein